jgi:hypothetical protein
MTTDAMISKIIMIIQEAVETTKDGLQGSQNYLLPNS